MRLAAGNPMTRVLLALLCFEAVVFALAVAGMIQVSGVPVGTAFAVGLGAAGLAALSAAVLRSPVGYALAWLTQLVGIALGFATEMMFWVGGMFALLWVMTFVLGRRLEGLPSGEGRERSPR